LAEPFDLHHGWKIHRERQESPGIAIPSGGAMDIKIFLAILIVATILLMANYFAAPL
jgi:hypothetical protein